MCIYSIISLVFLLAQEYELMFSLGKNLLYRKSLIPSRLLFALYFSQFHVSNHAVYHWASCGGWTRFHCQFTSVDLLVYDLMPHIILLDDVILVCLICHALLASSRPLIISLLGITSACCSCVLQHFKKEIHINFPFFLLKWRPIPPGSISE